MSTLQDVLAAVQAETTLVAGVQTLVQNLESQLQQALSGQLTPEQQAQVDQIFAGVKANAEQLTTALQANVPATPPAAS